MYMYIEQHIVFARLLDHQIKKMIFKTEKYLNALQCPIGGYYEDIEQCNVMRTK